MKYNTWLIVERADENNDNYEDLKETQRMLKSFDNLKDAENYLKQLQEQEL